MLEDKIQNGIEVHFPTCGEDECSVNAFQELDICVPVTIEPFVTLGDPVVECIDDPCITPVACHSWNRNGTCKFTVSQKLCVMVPIEFKATASSGTTSVCCGDASDEDCQECDENGGYEHQPKTPCNHHNGGKNYRVVNKNMQ